jgi:DNA-binding MarR family transcriptional regulator/N-acetylglutamate synthase-like GNAT family acetyltransferase
VGPILDSVNHSPEDAPVELDGRIHTVRRFNRFYTRQIGLLHEGLAGSAFPLTEARVLYELAHRERPTATDLCRDLGLDAGYLSRILRSFEHRGLVQKTRSATDGRRSHLSLTARGEKAFAPLDARSHADAGAMLRSLAPPQQAKVVAAMRTIEALLHRDAGRPAPYVVRQHRPGDMGAVIRLHGMIYTREYGWDHTFEALVARIAARFIERHDPARERCWIAEQDGEVVGSVFLVKKSRTVGQLRLMIVDPRARGLGIGARLVDECLRFARRAGYRKVTLWTNSVLLAARHLYARAGFRLVHEERHRSFGKDLIGETWERVL